MNLRRRWQNADCIPHSKLEFHRSLLFVFHVWLDVLLLPQCCLILFTDICRLHFDGAMESVIVACDKVLQVVNVMVGLLLGEIHEYFPFQCFYDTFCIVGLDLIVGDKVNHTLVFQVLLDQLIGELCTSICPDIFWLSPFSKD